MSRRTRGKFSIWATLLLVAIVAGLYFGFMYLPVAMNKWAVRSIADAASTRMMVEHDDMAIRNDIAARAKEQGITISISSVFLQRTEGGNAATVTIRWEERVKHLWGSTHSMKMEVVGTARRTDITMGKNAQ